jgi:nucleoside-diphosphate kinase
MPMEKTLVIIKPNGVSSGLIGTIISRYEASRLAVSAIKIKQLTISDIQGFYAEHVGKDFFAGLSEFMVSGPVILLALSGENAVQVVRTMNGATNPAQALPGTIRYDFAPSIQKNVVHSSDSVDSALREIAFWFNQEELVEYHPFHQQATK